MGRERGPKLETEIDITPEALTDFIKFSCSNSDLIGLKNIVSKYKCQILTEKDKNKVMQLLYALSKKEQDNPLFSAELREVVPLFRFKYNLVKEDN